MGNKPSTSTSTTFSSSNPNPPPQRKRKVTYESLVKQCDSANATNALFPALISFQVVVRCNVIVQSTSESLDVMSVVKEGKKDDLDCYDDDDDDDDGGGGEECIINEVKVDEIDTDIEDDDNTNAIPTHIIDSLNQEETKEEETPTKLNYINSSTLDNDNSMSLSLSWLNTGVFSSSIYVLMAYRDNNEQQVDNDDSTEDLKATSTSSSSEEKYALIRIPDFLKIINLLERLQSILITGSLSEEGGCKRVVSSCDSGVVSFNLNDKSVDAADGTDGVDGERTISLDKEFAVSKMNDAIERECPICMDDKVTTICASCMMGFCSKCALVTNDDDSCPLCAVKQGGEGDVWKVETWSDVDVLESVDVVEAEIEKLVKSVVERGREVDVDGYGGVEEFYIVR